MFHNRQPKPEPRLQQPDSFDLPALLEMLQTTRRLRRVVFDGRFVGASSSSLSFLPLTTTSTTATFSATTLLSNTRCAATTLTRHQSTTSASARRRILCSLQQLKALNGKGLKFGLTKPPGAKKSKRYADTGFAFMCEFTDEPRAFENRCPHANVELDMDDSDFFDNGFIICKVHGAMFDPETGECLRGVHGGESRRQIRPLKELKVIVEDDQVVLLEEYAAVAAGTKSEGDQEEEESSSSSSCDCAYDCNVDSDTKASDDSSSLPSSTTTHADDKYQRLQEVLNENARDIQRFQDEIDRKARERIEMYRELDHQTATARFISKK